MDTPRTDALHDRCWIEAITDDECYKLMWLNSKDIERELSESARKLEEAERNHREYERIIGMKSYQEIADEIAQLQQQLAEARKDADRYRYLRGNMTFYNTAESGAPVLAEVCSRIWYHATNNEEYPLDAMIDSALEASRAD